MITTLVESLLIGRPQPFTAAGMKSAMARSRVDGPVMLRQNGFDGDEVADKKAHGGPEKALHLYPPEHYRHWNVLLNGHPLLSAPGAFGENISASGMTEDKTRIGDQFRMGKAVVQICQARQPCWKIDHRFSAHGVSREIIRSGKCGLYFRVIEEGEVASGDVIEQIEQAPHDWTVERVFALLIGGKHREDGAKAQLAELMELESLSRDWRERAAKLHAARDKG